MMMSTRHSRRPLISSFRRSTPNGLNSNELAVANDEHHSRIDSNEKRKGSRLSSRMDLLAVFLGRLSSRSTKKKNSSRWRTLREYFRVREEVIVSKLWLLMGGSLFTNEFDRLPRGRSRNLFLNADSDVNAPDLYLPTMAFFTLVISSTLIRAHRGESVVAAFERVSLSAIVMVLVVVLATKFLFFIWERQKKMKWLDLLSYLGYSLVPSVVIRWSHTLGHIEFVLVTWLFLSGFYGLFLYRTLWAVLGGRRGGKRLQETRHRLLLSVTVVQSGLMLLLGSF